jgi:hypothetical protein
VTWSFELKNPIGSINTYNNSGLITYQQLKMDMNNTIININPNSEIPFGAYIDVEEGEGDQPIPMYNGTPIEINETTPIWAFTSVTKNSNTRSINKQVITYNGVTTSEIRLGYQGYSAYIIAADDHYDIYIPVNTFTTNRSWRIQQADTALLVSNINQNFGTIIGQEDKTVTVYIGESSQGTSQQPFTHYSASKEYYTTQLANNRRNEAVKAEPPKIYILKKAKLPITQEQPEEDEFDIEQQEEIQPTHQQRSKSTQNKLAKLI